MSKFKKCLMWYLMCTKRLLHKWTFIVVLCLRPILIPSLHNVLLNSESGVLKIALCNEDNDPATVKIIDRLQDDEGIIIYTVVSSPEEATKLVDDRKVDGAWVFTPELSKKTDRAVSGLFKVSLVKIIECEDTIPLKLSREVLHGAMYNELSYSIYKQFVFEDMELKGTVTEETLRNYYDNEERLSDIIELKTLNNEVEQVKANLLTAPIRGMVSLLVVLCTIAAVMYFLKDRTGNKFSWLSPEKRIIPAFATCLAAAVLSGVTVFITLQFSGISVGFLRELVSMILFIIGTTGFCLILCIVFRTPGILGASLPGIIIGMLLLAPIFFNITGVKIIKACLPMNYYMNSLYETEYILQFAIYCIVTFAVAAALNFAVNKIPAMAKR